MQAPRTLSIGNGLIYVSLSWFVRCCFALVSVVWCDVLLYLLWSFVVWSCVAYLYIVCCVVLVAKAEPYMLGLVWLKHA